LISLYSYFVPVENNKMKIEINKNNKNKIINYYKFNKESNKFIFYKKEKNK